LFGCLFIYLSFCLKALSAVLQFGRISIDSGSELTCIPCQADSDDDNDWPEVPPHNIQRERKRATAGKPSVQSRLQSQAEQLDVPSDESLSLSEFLEKHPSFTISDVPTSQMGSDGCVLVASDNDSQGNASESDQHDGTGPTGTHNQGGMESERTGAAYERFTSNALPGDIRYDHYNNSVRAHCSVHGHRCRWHRTLNPKEDVPAQGRPVAALCCWLALGRTCKTSTEHRALKHDDVKDDAMPLLERERFRDWVDRQKSFRRLTRELERKRRPGEGIEPHNCP